MPYRRRRVLGALLIAFAIALYINQTGPQPQITPSSPSSTSVTTGDRAQAILEKLPVKGRAPKTDYTRTQFGDGWSLIGTCDMRNIILHRDLSNAVVNDSCKVTSGILNDPYTGTVIAFTRGPSTSDDVQIDHVVALSNAWQTGAQLLSLEERTQLANDPLELLAVDGDANQAKGDGDAATWLPANRAFRCQYVARQIAVKAKYHLWVTDAEKSAMQRVLETCPDQTIPVVTSGV